VSIDFGLIGRLDGALKSNSAANKNAVFGGVIVHTVLIKVGVWSSS